MADVIEIATIIVVICAGFPWAAWTLIFKDMYKTWKHQNDKT